MTITISEKLKSAAAELPLPSAALPRHLDARDNVVSFRQLGGDFGQTVQSIPGGITFVLESGKEAFREAVLNGKMDIRAGAQELHSSEIYFVQNHETLLKASTVTEALRASGVPSSDIGSVLQALGLKAAAQLSPRDLGISALKRLSIGCSLHARARILLYDRPFLGSDPAWVERIAQLLLSQGEGKVRSVIITGETKLPEAWASHPRVSVQNPQQPQQASGMLARGANGQLPPRAGADASIAVSLFTRPQPIYQQGTRANETLQSEAIENPNLEFRSSLHRLGGTAGLNQVEREAETNARAASSITEEEQRRQEGELTRVTGMDRFHAHPAYRKLSDSLRKVRGRLSAKPAEVAIPPAKRLLALKKKREARLAFVILIFVIAAICLFSYFSK